jgi:hypothetical protein
MRRYRAIAAGCLASCLAGLAPADDRVERFDRDPNWDSQNNRASAPEARASRRRRTARLPHAPQSGDRPQRIGRLRSQGRRTPMVTQVRPVSNGGSGSIMASIDDQTAVCHLTAGHKADGATFNRFGILDVIKSADLGGQLWMDDVTVNGLVDDFGADPAWDQLRNRVEYVSTNVRPRFDFGFSPTRYAGGRAGGELGGLVFRGDCRYPARMACRRPRRSRRAQSPQARRRFLLRLPSRREIDRRVLSRMPIRRRPRSIPRSRRGKVAAKAAHSPLGRAT